jgi:hypothetical protein
MIIKRVFQNAWMPGIVLLFAAHANASIIINYTTNAPGTEFVAGINSDTLNSTGGVAATIVFTPNTTSGTGVPSNINLGDFQLTCGACTTSQTTTFAAFTFDLVVTDSTDGATGEFIGISTGGTISSNSSTVQVNWQAPLTIGPGTTGAMTGNFGTTHFDMVSPITLIDAPNSGSPAGDSTVNGQLNSTLTDAPEPASFALIGAGLLGFGLLSRKNAIRA